MCLNHIIDMVDDHTLFDTYEELKIFGDQLYDLYEKSKMHQSNDLCAKTLEAHLNVRVEFDDEELVSP